MTSIKLIFSVFGDSFSPNLFTKLSKVSPTNYWVKGDVVTSRKYHLIREETCWEYSFDTIQTLKFDTISDLFLSQFKSNSDELSSFIKEFNLQSKVEIVVEIVNNEKPSIFFDRYFLDLILKLNGEIDIDLYLLKGNLHGE